MCFPSKKQNNNFADEQVTTTQKGEPSTGIKTLIVSNPISSTPHFLKHDQLLKTPCPLPKSLSSSTPCTATSPSVRIPPHVLQCSLIDFAQWLRLRKPVSRRLVARPTFTCTHRRRPFPSLQLTLSRVQETLSDEVLAKMHAPPKTSYPTITPDILATYDAILVGVPTRYGNMPGQWKVCF
jgi:NAD(P)H dehydrogenase (quinone)